MIRKVNNYLTTLEIKTKQKTEFAALKRKHQETMFKEAILRRMEIFHC